MTVTAGILAEAWIKRYYELADAGDMDGAMEYVAPDGVLRFANHEPLIGRQAIHSAMSELTGNWARQTHTLLDLWELPGNLVAFETEVRFVRHDGTTADVRGAAICRIDGETFLEQRIFVDLSAAFGTSVS